MSDPSVVGDDRLHRLSDQEDHEVVRRRPQSYGGDEDGEPEDVVAVVDIAHLDALVARLTDGPSRSGDQGVP